MKLSETVFIQNLKKIPERILELIIKLIGRKGVMLGGTFYLVLNDQFQTWFQVVAWVFICLFVIGGAEGMKWLKLFKDIKE